MSLEETSFIIEIVPAIFPANRKKPFYSIIISHQDLGKIVVNPESI